MALFFVALIISFFVGNIVLAVPNIINYQGRLRDNSGTPINTSTIIQFSIYNHLTNGSPEDTPNSNGPLLWKEVYNGSSSNCPKIQPDAQGYFTVNLGSCEAFPSYLDFSSGNYYLAVKIETDNEATPRVILATHPFAFNSDRIDGLHATTTATANQLLALDNEANFNLSNGLYLGGAFSMNSSTATSTISGNLSVIKNSLFATTTISHLIVSGASYLDTIIAGTWQGSVIGTVYGGTGIDTSGWTGFVKVVGGVWTTSTINLTADITGVLSIANGGTNASSFSVNEFIWFNGTSLVGSGFTSTSFMATSTDNWVDTTGDTMTGPLIINSNLTTNGNLYITGANRYLNFGTVTGTDGYGIRDNAGVMQWKNASGVWKNFSTKVDHIINVAKEGGDFSELAPAIEAANALPYDVIINIYPGTYDVSSTLVVTSTHIKNIRGMAKEAIIIRPTEELVSSSAPIFDINFVTDTDFGLRLVTIDGSQTPGFKDTSGCAAIKISSEGNRWLEISDINIVETNVGIDMQVANLLNVVNVNFYRIGDVAFNLDNGASLEIQTSYIEDTKNKVAWIKSTTRSSTFYMINSEFGSLSGLGTGIYIEGDASYAELRNSNLWGLNYNIQSFNNSEVLVTSGFLQRAASFNIEQNDNSKITIINSSGNFSSTDLSIENPTNFYISVFNSDEKSLVIGSGAYENQNIFMIDRGELLGTKLRLAYQNEYFTDNGVIFRNPNLGESNIFAVESNGGRASLAAITTNRDSPTTLNILSDTSGNVGYTTSSLRGWKLAKMGTSGDLTFNFLNTDTGDGKSFISFTPLRLDGFNKQSLFNGGAIFNSSSGNFDFRVLGDNDNYALFVQGSTDSVGIGTSTPGYKLTVQGDINITGTYRVNGTPLTSLNPGNAIGQTAFWDGSAWSPTSSLFISAEGRIGIGTTTPLNALSVVGGINIVSGTPSNITYTLYNNNGQLYWNGSPIISGNTSTYIQDMDGNTKVETEENPNENKIRFYTASQQRMIITEDGRIGIGTTTPGLADQDAHYLVDIEMSSNTNSGMRLANLSAGNSASTEINFYNNVGQGGTIFLAGSNFDGFPNASDVFGMAATAGNDLLLTALGGNIRFATMNQLLNGSSSIYIVGSGANEGFVGINTSTPLASLSIFGNVFIEGENRYLNFGTTTGELGYGFRDNNGVIELRNINNNHNVWSEIVINDSLIEGNIIYVNAESGKDSFDGRSIARAKKTIQSAIDAAAASSSASNPYTVSVSAGTFTENLQMKDFVVVKGAGCNTFIVGKVTFDMTYGSVLSMVNLKNYDDYAVEIKSAGRSVLKNVEVGAEYTDDSKNIQAVIYQENGTLESFTANKYNFTQTTNTAGTKINTIFYFTSSTIVSAYIYNPEIFVNTYDSDDDLSVLYTENQSFRSVAIIKDPIITFPIYVSSPVNTVKIFNHNNARFNTYIDAAFTTVLTVAPGSVKLIPAYVNSSTVLSGVQITNSSFSWAGPGIDENNVYLSAANTVNDYVILTSNQYKTQSDIFPTRYTADGASGTLEYFISNGHGNLQNKSFATFEGSFGIGTSTPYDRLEVWGDDLSSTATSSRNYITIVANGNGEAGHYIRRVNSGSYDNGWSWYMPTSSLDFRLWDDSIGAEGDDILTVQAGTGFIGIGQALYNPLNKLHVDGGIYLGNTATATTTNSLYNINGDLYWNGNLLATAGGATANWVLASHNGTTVLTTSTTIPVWFKDIIYTSSSVYIDGILNVLGLVSMPTTTITKLTVNNIDNLYTVSTTDLIVGGSITLGGVTRNTWPSGGGVDSIWATTTANVTYPDLSGDYAVVIGNIATSSNVKFEVVGDTKLGGNVTITGSNAVTETSTLTGPVLLGNYAQFTTAGNNNFYFSNNTNNYLRWNNSVTQFELSNGLSVIGAVSTTDNMYAGGGFDTNNTYRINGLDYGQFFIDNAGTAGYIWMASSTNNGRGYWVPTSSLGLGLAAGSEGNLQFNKNGILSATATLTWNDSNSHLGIGTSSPSAPLHVVSNQAGPTMVILQKTITGATNLNFVTQNNKYWQLSKRDGIEDDKFRFYFNDGSLFYNVLTLGSTGTIGINNDNPEAMLTITGTTTYPLLSVYTSSSQSAIYIDNLGRISFGTTSNPGTNFYAYSNSSPIFTRNIGGAGGIQAAMQIGVDNTTTSAGTGPSYLFFANDAAGNKEFLGRMSAVWEDSTNGAERGAITLSIRSGSGDTTASTEAMRITSYGFIGLSTSTPPAFLSLYTNTSGLINITNSSTGYTLLEGKYLSQNFGMSLEAGALIQRNSYFGEEFMRERANVTIDTLYGWGDFQQFAVDENTVCTWLTVNDAVNGIGQQAARAGSSCLASYANTVATNAHLVFNAVNLPVFVIKAYPSAHSATALFWIGAGDMVAAQSTDPTNGIYFTNNTTTGVWRGVTRRAGVSTNVDCSGQSISTTVFAALKIEVVKSNDDGTGEVRFYVDNNTTNGINWFYCGQSTTNIPTVGLTAMIMNYSTANHSLNIDYYRVWQDDSVEITPISQIIEEIPQYIEKNLFGMAQIKAGDTYVQVSFDGEYAVPPMMGVTPLNFDGRWKLQNVTTAGFEISLSEPSTENILFNWQAYMVDDETKIYSSDGNIQLLKDFYKDFNPLVNIPQSESSGESTPAMPSETSTPPVEENPLTGTSTEPIIETPSVEAPMESVIETTPVEEPVPTPEVLAE